MTGFLKRQLSLRDSKQTIMNYKRSGDFNFIKLNLDSISTIEIGFAFLSILCYTLITKVRYPNWRRMAILSRRASIGARQAG